jgi:phosphonopyruvate decarboxylase
VISADAFLGPARERGFDFYTGVPCSFLTPMINRVISDRALDYVGAASEGEAVAIASGAWLAGRKTVVMCQNSGLGNTVNPLTSLNFPFRVPTLMIVTHRGQPGLADEPQHELMGEITEAVLDVMRIPNAAFPQDDGAVVPAVEAAEHIMDETGLPFAFVMAKGSVAAEGLDETPWKYRERGDITDLSEGAEPVIRYAMLERFAACVPADAAVVASTGFCGRELFNIADRERHLYQVGSMGCAAGMGLGVALNTRRPVVVLDGDGAALMKLGTLATIGAQAPANLVHVILDNGAHESTGGQATVSPNVDFAQVAIGCGYRSALRCDTPDGFERALAQAIEGPGPVLVHARIRPGTIDDLPRPTVKPPEVAQRFKAFLAT